MNIMMVNFDKYESNEIQALAEAYYNVCKDPLLILPHDIGLISDVSTEQLIKIRDFIDKELEKKL